jgi:hypothetical protein
MSGNTEVGASKTNGHCDKVYRKRKLKVNLAL